MDFIGVSSFLLFLYRPEFMGQDFVTLFIDPEFFNHQFYGHADVQFIEIASRKHRLDLYVRQIDPAVSVGGLTRKNFVGCCMMTLKLSIFPGGQVSRLFGPDGRSECRPLFLFWGRTPLRRRYTRFRSIAASHQERLGWSTIPPGLVWFFEHQSSVMILLP